MAQVSPAGNDVGRGTEQHTPSCTFIITDVHIFTGLLSGNKSNVMIGDDDLRVL